MRGVEQKAGKIEQLNFDTLTESPEAESEVQKQTGTATATLDEAAGIKPEATLFSLPRRNRVKKRAVRASIFEQATLDTLFSGISEEEPEQEQESTKNAQPRRRKQTVYDQHAALTQLDFETLAAVPPQDATTASEGEPPGGAVDQDSDTNG